MNDKLFSLVILYYEHNFQRVLTENNFKNSKVLSTRWGNCKQLLPTVRIVIILFLCVMEVIWMLWFSVGRIETQKISQSSRLSSWCFEGFVKTLTCPLHLFEDAAVILGRSPLSLVGFGKEFNDKWRQIAEGRGVVDFQDMTSKMPSGLFLFVCFSYKFWHHASLFVKVPQSLRELKKYL